MKRPTKDSDGRYNGYLVPIWNELESPALRPSQVYLTAVAPHSRKGPHLHKIRRGLFCCVKGNVLILARDDRGFRLPFITGEDHGFRLVEIPPGIAAAIYNYGDEEALVLNMPAPAWSKEQPDDWPVEGWQDPDGWNDWYSIVKAA